MSNIESERLRRIVREVVRKVVIREDPDMVELESGKRVHFTDSQAYPFGFDSEGEAYVGPSGYSHGQISGVGYGDMEYPGRIFTDIKVVSFWRYPDDKEKLLRLLEELEIEMNLEQDVSINFDNSWRIEIKTGLGNWEIIPLYNYVGSEDASEEEIAQHLDAPLEKASGEEKWKMLKMRGKQKGDRYKGGSEEEKFGFSVDDPEYSDELERFREVVRKKISNYL